MFYHANREQDFWAHVDRSAGPAACWPWLLGRDAAGHGRFRFEHKTRSVHQIAYFLQHGEWLERKDVCACTRLRHCCNQAHIVKRLGGAQHPHKSKVLKLVREHERVGQFSALLEGQYPLLGQLAEVLGDRLSAFLDCYEGQVLTIPSRAVLRETARALDCYHTLKCEEAARSRLLQQLQDRYNCEVELICEYALKGEEIFRLTEGEM